MYRIIFFCLLLNLIEATGWHKPIIKHHSPRLSSYKNHATGPCGVYIPDDKEQNPTTSKPNVIDDPVTEKDKPSPFKDVDEAQEQPNQGPEKTFEYLTNKTVNTNKVNKNFCKVYSKEALEYFTSRFYKLIIPLMGYDADNIIVKTKNNMVYIKGNIPDEDIDIRFEEDDKNDVFEAIYKVPDIVDTKKVSWVHSKGRLEITFRFKIQFDIEVTKTCDRDYNVDNEMRTALQMDADAISEIFNESKKINKNL